MRAENLRKSKETTLIFTFQNSRARVVIKKWEEDQNVVTLRQVHSAKVYFVESPVQGLEGDAMITQRPGLKIGVRTADCVPLALLGEKTVAVVHAGWRGLREGIVERVIEKLGKLEPVENYLALIGPSAKACCYQVGEEFRDFFVCLHFKNGRYYMDTQSETLLKLKRMGIRRVLQYNICTICHQSLPSHRRDRTQERMLTYAEILA